MTTKSEEKTEDFQKNPLWEHIIYIPYEFVQSDDLKLQEFIVQSFSLEMAKI